MREKIEKKKFIKTEKKEIKLQKRLLINNEKVEKSFQNVQFLLKQFRGKYKNIKTPIDSSFPLFFLQLKIYF